MRPAINPQAAIVRTGPAHPLPAVAPRATAVAGAGAGAVGSCLAAMAGSIVMVATAQYLGRRCLDRARGGFPPGLERISR
jgi:hypothetical protein